MRLLWPWFSTRSQGLRRHGRNVAGIWRTGEGERITSIWDAVSKLKPRFCRRGCHFSSDSAGASPLCRHLFHVGWHFPHYFLRNLNYPWDFSGSIAFPRNFCQPTGCNFYPFYYLRTANTVFIPESRWQPVSRVNFFSHACLLVYLGILISLPIDISLRRNRNVHV